MKIDAGEGGASPSLYQINTRVWLTDLTRRLGRQATLDDIPDAALDNLASLGFDWVWFLGVWRTGAAGALISRTRPEWRHEFEQTLPDLTDADIGGSCFAITAYQVPQAYGGDAALARLRRRLGVRGLKLMLDFVPNHTALDHPWMQSNPEYYVPGNVAQWREQPQNYFRAADDKIIAHGRDPYFPGWPDTAQLNYANPDLRRAMQVELLRIAGQCDGVRCDMAMLVLPDIFARTWNLSAEPFWPQAIGEVKRLFPKFRLLAEVYWDLEWTLQRQGFDYAYDKRLYDRLRDGHARLVRAHLQAPLDYQQRLARFLENHDEPRAAATFADDKHRAAAVVTLLTPGLRFVHDGQIEGRRLRIAPHLGRAPTEPLAETLRDFYLQLLVVSRRHVIRDGAWQLLETISAWPDNPTAECLIAWTWHTHDERLLVVVNFAPHPSQGFVQLPFVTQRHGDYRLRDFMHSIGYVRAADDIARRGLYLDMPPWGYHVFDVERAVLARDDSASESLDIGLMVR